MYAVFGLDDTDAFIAMTLRSQYKIELFNPSNVESDSIQGTTISSNVATISNNKCAVCGSQENLTVAHIFKTAAACATIGSLGTNRISFAFVALMGKEERVPITLTSLECHS